MAPWRNCSRRFGMLRRASDFCLLTSVFLLPLFAQHEANPGEGMLLFRANCVVCHGPTGAAVGGGIDLLQAKFKRPSSDADITRYIRSGITGTAMEKINLTDAQIADIIAYMRASAKL